jgi:hypothetical protein
MDSGSVLRFIGSKWFLLILALVMMALLPTTYGNLMIVWKAGAMGKLWWVPTVFVCNLLAAIMAIYKAAGMFFDKKKVEQQREW